MLDPAHEGAHHDLRGAVSSAVERGRQGQSASGFRRAEWERVADAGVLDLGGEGEESAPYLVSAALELGRRGAYGPYATTVMARNLSARSTTHDPGAAGVVVVAELATGLVPWGEEADLILADVDGRWWRCEPVGEPDCVRSMSGERWWRVPLRPCEPWGRDARATALAHLVVGAWAVGRAQQAVADAATYVGVRRQFNRPLRDFQAISHPLAEAEARLSACEAALQRAAVVLDCGGPQAVVPGARTASTRTALKSLLATHQTYGALGFISDGPLGSAVLQVRELCSLPPGDRVADRSVLDHLFAAESLDSTPPTREAP